MMTDPISDMLTRVRNALQAGHETVRIPASKIKVAIARILAEEGFVSESRVVDGDPAQLVELRLKYFDRNRPVIERLERVSKPGRRVYCTKDTVPVVRNGLGVAIVSTSQGVVTDRKCRELGVGGEVVCRVW